MTKEFKTRGETESSTNKTGFNKESSNSSESIMVEGIFDNTTAKDTIPTTKSTLSNDGTSNAEIADKTIAKATSAPPNIETTQTHTKVTSAPSNIETAQQTRASADTDLVIELAHRAAVRQEAESQHLQTYTKTDMMLLRILDSANFKTEPGTRQYEMHTETEQSKLFFSFRFLVIQNI